MVDTALSLDFPLGVELEVFIRREDAERFIEEVRAMILTSLPTERRPSGIAGASSLFLTFGVSRRRPRALGALDR